jgi:site-specific recombinase XerC
MSGCGIRTVQQLLGHTTVKTTMKYAHLSREHLQEAINLVGARLSHKVETNLKQSENHHRKPLLRL